MYTLICATLSLISGLLISDLYLLFHALLVLNYTTSFNPHYYCKIFLMHFRLEQGSNVVLPFKSGKKFSTGGKRKRKLKRKWRYWCRRKIYLFSSSFLSLQYTTQQGKRTKFSVQYFWRAPHRQERDLEKKYIIFVWSKTPTLRRYLSIPFNDIRKHSVKLRRTVSVVAKKLHHFFWKSRMI